MLAYEAKEHEPLLIGWWAALGESAEFEQTFQKCHRRLGAFLDYFNQSAYLVFEVDAGGIWFAAWSQPWCDGAIFSLWIRENRRRQPSARKAMELSYQLALEAYPVLIGYTIQAGLHAIHLKLGYEYGGRVPGLIACQTVYCYYLTREGWARRRTVAREVRMKRKLQYEHRESPNGAVH